MRHVITWAVIVLAVFVDLRQASAEVFQVTVSALRNESNPVATTIFVPQRSMISVSVTGTITLEPGVGVQNGVGAVRTSTRPGGMTFGAPVVVIHGIHTSIEGGDRSWTAPHSGRISLYIADTDTTDNTGSYTFTINVGPQLVGDTDDDGLEDAFEDEVLAYFAPHLKFTLGEDAWPSTVPWHARLSTVEADSTNTVTVQTIKYVRQDVIVPFYPEWHIARRDLPPSPFVPVGSRHSTLLDYGAITDTTEISASQWRMGHDNNWRRGEDPSRLMASNYTLGLYGRVYQPSENRLWIGYMHFFSYSDVDLDVPDFGAHEGDWEYFDLMVEYDALNPRACLTPEKIMQARWWAHGKRIEWRRQGIVPPSGTFEATAGSGGTWYDFQNPLPCVDRLGNWPNIVGVHHLPALIQPQGHGFFPTEFSWLADVLGCIGNDPALGNSSLNGIPTEVANIGEFYRPRLGMEVIAQYSGRWGAEALEAENPEGPITKPTHWPDRSLRGRLDTSYEGRYLGNWDHGRAMPDGVFALQGRISWPHRSFADALAGNVATPGRTILIYPNYYPATNFTTNTPAVLQAPHGGVTIGGP